jgi:sugar lactone lactonase YvrE
MSRDKQFAGSAAMALSAAILLIGLFLSVSCKMQNLELRNDINGYSLTLSSGSGGKIASPSASRITVHGLPTSIVASAYTGFVFVDWTVISGTVVSFGSMNNETTTVTVSGGDAVIQANFGKIIETIAGNGTEGHTGDLGPATSAELDWPRGLAVDPSGNVFIADTFSDRIRRIDSAGIITTVAGSDWGFSGDGYAATSAELEEPYDVAFDQAGNFYIADYDNNRIRKVATNGIITTVAGNGTSGYSGDGLSATSAKLNYPTGVAVDSAGNLYIADSGNYRVRKVDIYGTITTFAGNGTYGTYTDGDPATEVSIGTPSDVAVDSAGDVYFDNGFSNHIYKVDTHGIITNVAGNGTSGYSGDGGLARLAELNDPTGIAVDADGNIYFADTWNNRIRMISPAGIITTVAGTSTGDFAGDGGLATLAELKYPEGVAVDAAGNLYIADTQNNRVRRVP